ncbi:MAG: ATP-binding protein [Rhodobacteraceae bacterium]|nr:ATP-binding protein [Paracoccaceae bacterium]
MSFAFLKRYVPRGLFGRAALILVLPVVVLQLVVSVIFIQRHFEDVTAQMTQTMAREMRLVLEAVQDAPDQPTALARIGEFAPTLGIGAAFAAPGAVPSAHMVRWYDFSGRVMIGHMTRAVPRVQTVLLPDNRRVTLFLRTDLGPLEIDFSRRRVSASNPHQLLVNMVFFGGLMTIIAYVYLRNQLRPITRLAHAAQAFGRGRNLPYAPGGAIEVRAAGHAFLDMRNRIERAMEQRTLMLSGVSHDLRTPLTRMKLSLAMQEGAEAEALLRDVNEMQQLVDSFLDFARGDGEGEPQATDPVALVRQVVADAVRSGKPAHLVETTGTGQVMLRPLAIRRAVENLLNNAVRHGTRAELSVTLTDKSLRLRVEDDGPGIPPERRGEALRPFTRLDPARNQDAGGGVGLGLAIAADVARAHGGVLRLGESRTLGGLCADIVIGR